MSAPATAALGAPAGLGRAPMFLVGFGHCGTHWVMATFLTVLPFVTTDLGLSYTQTGFLIAIFHASAALANLPSGIVVDVTGRRVLYQGLALVVGALGLIGFASVEASWALALCVMVMGATNMLWHPAAISYLSLAYPSRKGLALAVHALGANLGDALAPLAAGAMLATMTWERTALLNAAPVLLAAALIFALLHRSHARRPVPHVSTGGVRAYLSGMGRLLKRRSIWLLALLAGFRTMAQAGLVAFLPLYLVHDMKVGPFWMGFAMAMLQVGGMIATPAAGLWSDRIGRRPVVFAGLFATTALVFALTFITSVPLYVAGVSLLGFCMYALRPVIHSWMMDLAPKELGASITSLVFGTQAGLSTLMPLIGGFLADRYGLVAVFYFFSGLVLVANALTLFVPKEGSARG